MQFIHEVDVGQAAKVLANRLVLDLQAKKSIVWFVSGGSNIPLTVQIMEQIPEALSRQLTILLLDERFGKPGHSDSNWQQLQAAGLKPKQARLLPTLMAEGTLDDTCRAYDTVVHETIAKAKKAGGVIIAQCGIGGDGHIAGILPQSSAVTNSEWVTCYDGGTYQRITITPVAWEHIDTVYAFAYGATKRGALQRLKNDALSVSDQPAQLLKLIPEAYIYTDQEL